MRAITLLLLLLITGASAPAQKSVVVKGYATQPDLDQGIGTLEGNIRTLLSGKGYQITSDSAGADYRILLRTGRSSSNTSGTFTFVYLTTELSLFEKGRPGEKHHLLFADVKGAGVNMAAANQKAFQATGKKISDTLAQLLSNNARPVLANQPASTPTQLQPADVDINIPLAASRNGNGYALIIGNEDYHSYQQGLNEETNVDFAVNDATRFRDYVNKTLGIPEENIKLLLNGRSIDMHREIKKLVSYMKALNGKAEIILFYAGHGLPDEATREPYLIPVDVVGTDLQFAVKLSTLYADLAAAPSKRVTLFLDACFSGGARNQALIAARGVKIKPVAGAIPGNLVIFTASSGDQSSMAYKAKNHGMFTYYLLKKMQETRGAITYRNLADYLAREVALQSVRINNKEQNPTILTGSSLPDDWESWQLK